MSFSLKRLLIGQPLSTERAHEERLTKFLALPIFAADALSSTAYASEEIMASLLLAGASVFYLTPQISGAIAFLLAIVVISYRQIVTAYPDGGGAYIVSRENLGEVAAQTAGASLLVDYILTVAVSVSAGIAAITSLLHRSGHTEFFGHPMQEFVVPLCLVAVVLLTIANLRGVRESGFAFAVPSYTFIAVMYGLVGWGLYKLFNGTLAQVHSAQELQQISHSLREQDLKLIGHDSPHYLGMLTPFLLLRAFASGCTAMTGTEAISNGVTAFEEPTSKNANAVMTWMAFILATLFLGLSYLAWKVNALPPTTPLANDETVLSQVGHTVFGGGVLYQVLQISTCIILILAANTAFAGFPRLCAIQAGDGFLPRQLSNIGDKLVFNNGIFVLAGFSAVLIVLFKGSVHYLIPLYAVGVFLSFTLSQAGMVKRWMRLRDKGWALKAAVNGFGAICTGIVMLVFGFVKFRDGAWVVVLLIPALVFVFFKIKNHYRSVAKQLSLEGYRPRQGLRHHVLVLVPDIHRGVIPALQYARSLSNEAKAIHVSIDPKREARLRKRWTEYSRGVPLAILSSPFRSLVDPVVEYVERLQKAEPNSIVTLVVPEFVPTGWWPKLLHGQAALMLNVKLHLKPGIIVITVPYHIESFVELPHHSQSAAEANIHIPRGENLPPIHDDALISSLHHAAREASTPSASNGSGNGKLN